MGLLSTLLQCPPQDVAGSPDPPAPSQDTHSAPLRAGAGSLGFGPGQRQTVFPDLGDAVDSLALLQQSVRPCYSPLATCMSTKETVLCAVGVDDLRNVPVLPEQGQKSIGLGGRSRE